MMNALVEARRKELSATVRVMESTLPSRNVGQAAAD
jgi:hypothetical protein